MGGEILETLGSFAELTDGDLWLKPVSLFDSRENQEAGKDCTDRALT